MSDWYWLTHEPMARLQPHSPNSHGKPCVDDRGVYHVPTDFGIQQRALK